MKNKSHELLTPWEIQEHTHYKIQDLNHSLLHPVHSIVLSLPDPIFNSAILKAPSHLSPDIRLFSLEDGVKRQKKSMKISVIQADKCLQQNQSLFSKIKHIEKAKRDLVKLNEELVILQIIRGQLKEEKKQKKTKELHQKFHGLFPVLVRQNPLQRRQSNRGSSLNQLLLPSIS